jgi:hypothetical protein
MVAGYAVSVWRTCVPNAHLTAKPLCISPAASGIMLMSNRRTERGGAAMIKMPELMIVAGALVAFTGGTCVTTA